MGENSTTWTIGIIAVTVVIFGAILAANSKNQSPVKPVTVTDDQATILTITEADHIRGKVDAPVTLLEYGDFACPGCASFEPQLQRLITDYPDSLRIVYRHFPLGQHKNGELTARVAEAADRQGKFWEMHDLLYARQTDWANRGDAMNLMLDYALELGLNADQLRADLLADDVTAIIARAKGESSALKLPGTPSFFVNGQAIENPRSYEAFKQVIDAAANQ